jgi:ATP-dependent Clp endopeptidase proteolytic subunit ClpP
MKKDIYWASEDNFEYKVLGGENSSLEDNNQVTFKDNRLYFYSEVTRSKNLTLNKSIVELANYYAAIGTNLSTPPANLYLHINSYGGSVFAGLSSVDYIINSKVPVTTIIDGCAASAATLMSIVAPKRLMHKHAYMLIHQLSSGMWGKYEELKDDMENSENLMNVIKDIYNKHTNIPKKELDKILKHDLWWDAETCLKYGLIDEII